MITTTIIVRSSSEDDANTVWRVVDNALFDADTHDMLEWTMTDKEDAE